MVNSVQFLPGGLNFWKPLKCCKGRTRCETDTPGTNKNSQDSSQNWTAFTVHALQLCGTTTKSKPVARANCSRGAMFGILQRTEREGNVRFTAKERECVCEREREREGERKREKENYGPLKTGCGLCFHSQCGLLTCKE